MVNISQKAIKKILLKRFGIEVQNLKKLHGFYDLNYKVFGTNRDYFLKIHLIDSLRDVQFQNSIIERFKRNLLPVPDLYLTKQKSKIFKIGKYFCTLHKFLPGQELEKSLSVDILSSLGSLMAKMHKTTENWKVVYNRKYIWDLANFKMVIEDYIKNKKKFSKTNIYLLDSVISDFLKAKVNLQKLKKIPIHNDIHGNNILVNKGKISGIIDFADSVNSYRVADLALVVVQLCLTNKVFLKNTDAFVRAYARVARLSDLEVQYLPLLAKMRAVLLIVEANILTGFKPKGFYSKIIKQAELAIKSINDKQNLQSLNLVLKVLKS